MKKAQVGSNPFYVLLVVVGVVFVVTASAFGVLAYRGVTLLPSPDEPVASGLMGFLDRNGMKLLGGEVVLLGLLTVGAIGTDEYWQRKTKENE